MIFGFLEEQQVAAPPPQRNLGCLSNPVIK
jgi:hypothetical protein